MRTKTHLKFREPGDKGPTDLCSTIEGTLLNLPMGHRLSLDVLGKGISMREGFYEVYHGPTDTLFVAEDQESIYERCYSLKYVGGESK